VRSTALGAFERTHGHTSMQNALTVTPACSTHHGRTHVAPTDARSITVARSSTHATRSHAATHGATYGRTQHPTIARSLQPALAVICGRTYVCSNAGSAFECTLVSCQPINRPCAFICLARLGGAFRAQNPLFSTVNPS
jgi:hypothetical protein